MKCAHLRFFHGYVFFASWVLSNESAVSFGVSLQDAEHPDLPRLLPVVEVSGKDAASGTESLHASAASARRLQTDDSIKILHVYMSRD
jgi:hypothetical protein